MQRMMRMVQLGSAFVVVGLLLARPARADEEGHVPLWYVCAGIGQVNFEGDMVVEDGMLLNIRLGYDYSEEWSFEGVLTLAPGLDENFRTDFDTGREISRLQEVAGAGVDGADMYALAFDALYHFTRWDRVDPYVSLGVGLTFFSEEVETDGDPALRLGTGLMYHINDEWGLRLDGRGILAGSDTEANVTIDAGVMWTWDARIEPDLIAVAGPVDSDGDRLSDDDEIKRGTDPHNVDSDWDGLGDGAEVLDHRTDPLNRDTDGGGVADGHEVIEDSTNPLDPKDDLLMFTLNLRFDYDKSTIRREYYDDLDKVTKVLQRYPGANIRIEGHADKLKRSKAKYNERLSLRRAQSVLAFLADRGKVARKRMEAAGYGFRRPKARNNPVTGNPHNRRVEIYIDLPEGAREEVIMPEFDSMPPPGPAAGPGPGGE